MRAAISAGLAIGLAFVVIAAVNFPTAMRYSTNADGYSVLFLRLTLLLGLLVQAVLIAVLGMAILFQRRWESLWLYSTLIIPASCLVGMAYGAWRL